MKPPLLWRRALLCAAAALALPAAATQLQPHNLSKLIGQSDVIVAGKVTAVTEGLQGNLPYTEVTISVTSSAKKKLAPKSEFKFRQFGLQSPRKMPDGRFLLALAPEGFAHWRKDEHVIAFMFKPASKTGLRTTVGLAQGKFTSMGGRTANEFNNRGLFAGLQVAPGLLSAEEAAMVAKPAGDVDATTLMKLVDRAVTGQWVEKGVMK